MTDLLIGNDTFRIEVEGDTTKPALLLCHSLGGDLTQWDQQMPALLKTFRVIRYDSRGHGGSTVAGAPYSIATLGRDALAILDALEIETTHVIGLSMGGAVAQWLLVHAPHRVTRAVLANTSARFGATASWNQRIVDVLGAGMSAVVDATMTRWFSEAFTAAEPQAIEKTRAVFEATPPAGYAGCCAAVRDLDLRAALHAAAAPVLVISGRDDASVGPADTARLVADIPGAKHVVLDAHHISNVEAEAAFTKAVVTFLTAKVAAQKPVAKAAPRATPAAKPAGTRRIGTRRSTAARIPLASAPARAALTKTARKPTVPKAATPKATAPKAAAKSTAAKAAPSTPPKAKASAAKAPTTRVARKATSKTAPAKATNAKATKPAVAAPVKKTAVSKGAVAKSSPPTAKRPSAKDLRAMAAGTTKKPAAKTLGAKSPAAKASAVKAPAAKKPVAKKSVTKTPVAKPNAVKPKLAKATATKARVVKLALPKTSAKPRAKAPAKAPAKAAKPVAPARGKAAAKAPAKTTAATRKLPAKTSGTRGRRAS